MGILKFLLPVLFLMNVSSYPPNHILLYSLVKPKNMVKIALEIIPSDTSFLTSRSPFPLIKFGESPTKPSDLIPVKSVALNIERNLKFYVV